jgi:hypothetical protein
MQKTILALILSLSLLTVTTAFTQHHAIVTNNEARLRPGSTQPTTVPTPTFVPTIIPVSGVALSNQITPTTIPTSSFGESTPEVPVRTAPPLWLTLTLLGMCCVFLILIGMVTLGFIVRNQNLKGANNLE